MKRNIRVVISTAFALLLMAQFVPVARTNPPEGVFLSVPPEVEDVLKRSCYDCHSNRTVWPWYSRVAPISWWLVNHVQEGREELNFSEWDRIDRKERVQIFEEIIEEIEEGNMPLPSYVLGHPEARISARDLEILRNWAKSQSRRPPTKKSSKRQT